MCLCVLNSPPPPPKMKTGHSLPMTMGVYWSQQKTKLVLFYIFKVLSTKSSEETEICYSFPSLSLALSPPVSLIPVEDVNLSQWVTNMHCLLVVELGTIIFSQHLSDRSKKCTFF